MTNPDNLTNAQLALALNRSKSAIVSQLNLRREPHQKVMPRWSQDEVKLLKKHYKTHTDEQIAEMLGRTPTAVWGKRQRLELSRSEYRGRPITVKKEAKKEEPRTIGSYLLQFLK